MKKLIVVLGLLLVLPLASQAQKPDVPPGQNKQVHPVGMNVVSPDGTVWLITNTGERRPYISSTAFLSYGFNSFASIVSASKGDLALPVGSLIPPRDGQIVASNSGLDNGTAYVMSRGQKSAFTSAAVFTGLGYSFAHAISSNLMGVPYGPLITS